MGFQDLKAFNLAMFGKQLWRIIHFPDSLLSRVFKAKYFPLCDVLDSIPKANASFTWKSICGAMGLVKRGVRWKVGNGQKIKVLADNWIVRNSNLKQLIPDLLNIGDITVSNLLRLEEESWDEELIKAIFWEEDYEDILQIPVAAHGIVDIRVWNQSSNGYYTVRSAYYLAREMNLEKFQSSTGQSSSPVGRSWNWVWSLKLPNKLKVFLWSVLNNSLPTNDTFMYCLQE